MRVRPVPLGLTGAGAALLALSTLGLTWLERTADGPLGEAGAAAVEAVPGREAAPLVAALVPGVAAVVGLGLLLRGWWRVVALLLAALGGAAAALSAAAVAVGGSDDATTTAVPLVAALACATVAVACLVAALGTVGVLRARTGPQPEPTPGAPAADPATRRPQDAADMWRALDEGHDPTR